MLRFRIGLFPLPCQTGSPWLLQFSLFFKLILCKKTRFSLVILFIMFSLYDLANVVPTLAKFYHQASEAYEQACTRHISMIIYYVSIYSLFSVFSLTIPEFIPVGHSLSIFCLGKQFERLFQYARRIEDLIINKVSPEEVCLCIVCLLIFHRSCCTVSQHIGTFSLN